jgi:hypothetical protein
LALCLHSFRQIFFPSKVEVPRKLKLKAALPGFLIAISGAVSAQNPDDQAPDRFSMPAMKREHNKENLVMIATQPIGRSTPIVMSP